MPTEKYTLTEQQESEIGKPADFSFKKMTHLKPVGVESARVSRIGHLPSKAIETRKFLTRALWLNNNKLQSIANLDAFVDSVLNDPSQLGWLDVSYNYITGIDNVIVQYQNLKIMYFHGNHISELDELIKLRDLRELRSITFHGNPISEEPNYRLMVINLLPQIANLDFAPVTKSERMLPSPRAVLKLIPVVVSEVEDERPH